MIIWVIGRMEGERRDRRTKGKETLTYKRKHTTALAGVPSQVLME